MAGKAQAEGGFFLVRWTRGLYRWVMHWAQSPYATPMLGVLSFMESSFFPIPPDVLLIPMAASQPRKALTLGAVTSACSVLGGMFGYLIGFVFFDAIGIRIIELYGVMDKYLLFREWFEQYNFAIIMLAGLTPLPYKVFTITAGVAEVNFPVFVLGSVVSRTFRFMAEAAVCRFGESFSQRYFRLSVQELLDKYIEWFMVIMAVLGVAGFLVVKMVLPGSAVRLCRDLGSGGTLCLESFAAPGAEEKFDYRLSLAQAGGTVETILPGGPFLPPSRGEALLFELMVSPQDTVYAAAVFSELPPPDRGTDGEVVFYLYRDHAFQELMRLTFPRYRLGAQGAWSESALSITAENRDREPRNEIILAIETVQHSGRGGGDKSVEEEQRHYKLVGARLLEIGRQKVPQPAGEVNGP